MVQVPGDDAATANRCLRDVVALSTLPAIWLGAEMPRVAESLAAALFTTVSPDLVFVALRDPDTGREITVAQTDRYHTDEKLAAELARPLFAWAAAHDAEELAALACGPGMMHFAVRSLGYEAELGIIAAGYRDPESRTQFQSTLLGVGAAQAASQVRNCMLLRALRDAAAENARLVADLRAEDQRKNEFLATLAHELRNPLAPLRHALELLEADGARALPRLHGIMDRQVKHLVRLVDDLLEISRITHGTIDLRQEDLKLGDILHNAAESSASLIAAARHKLLIQPVAASLRVRGDGVRLAQVFCNLLNNAARYTDPGGEIRVEVAQEGNEAVVRVRDTGMGIAPGDTERIFEMFTQVERKPRLGVAGLGIGLALVKRLVELHGGSVQANSDGRGKGSTFAVRLPLATHATAAEPRQAPLPAAPARAVKVLAVDDNVDAVESLGMLLEMLGMDVRIAHDGRAGLAQFEAFRPDVVILDIGMPEMDGYELARRIRSHASSRGVKLVALTGWGQDIDRGRCFESGIDHHLTKPADIEDLQAVIGSVGADEAFVG